MKKIAIGIIILHFSAQAHVNYNESANDQSQEFYRIYQCYQRNGHGCADHFLNQADISHLKKLKFILVPGMQYEILTAFIHSLPRWLRNVVGKIENSASFPNQEAVLKSLGIRYKTFDLSKLSPVDFSKRHLLIDAIQKSIQCVAMMGHSKGGVDILDAIAHLHENKETKLFSKVKAFIPIQSPLQGTPHADLMDLNIQIPDPFRNRTTSVRGIFNNIGFLGTRQRIQWLRDHQNTVDEINRSVTTLSVGSYINTSNTFVDTILTLMMKPIFWLTNENNDGLVAHRGTILPGSNKIILPGIDHISTAMVMEGLPQTTFLQDSFTFAMLKILAKKLKDKDLNCRN